MKQCSLLILLLVSLFLLTSCATTSREDAETNKGQLTMSAEEFERIYGTKPTPQELKEANETRRKWLAIWKAADSHRFIVEGEVVDEEGNRMNGVSLGLGKATGGTIFNMNPRYIDAGDKTVNGTFKASARGCKSFILMFTKEGYYDVKLWLFSDDMNQLADSIRKGVPFHGMATNKSGLRVVMEKRGPRRDLRTYSNRLNYNGADGSGTYGDLKEWGNNKQKPAKNLDDPSQLPKDCVYVVAEKDGNGNIPSKVIAYGKPNNTNSNVIVLPRKVRLILNSEKEGEGFIRYELKKVGWGLGGVEQNPYREMKKAPETGYQKELVVDFTSLPDMVNRVGALEEQIVHFYCKIQGKFGKGHVSVQATNFRDSGERLLQVTAISLFLIQPDGSRELATGTRDGT